MLEGFHMTPENRYTYTMFIDVVLFILVLLIVSRRGRNVFAFHGGLAKNS